MIVIDASVAAKLILEEEFSEQAWRLYRSETACGVGVIAPELLLAEVTNTIRQQMRRSAPITLGRAQYLFDEFQQLKISTVKPDRLHHEALRIAAEFSLPAAYDAHYIAIAEMFKAELWTDDRRLIRQVSGKLDFVRWIGDYPSASDPPVVH